LSTTRPWSAGGPAGGGLELTLEESGDVVVGKAVTAAGSDGDVGVAGGRGEASGSGCGATWPWRDLRCLGPLVLSHQPRPDDDDGNRDDEDDGACVPRVIRRSSPDLERQRVCRPIRKKVTAISSKIM
jgi:hypothetical protein